MEFTECFLHVLFSVIGLLSVGTGAPTQRTLELRDVWNRRATDELNKRLNLKQNDNVAKNVVLVMGDGMGIPTVTGARIYKGQMAGRSGEETILSFEEFPYVGLAKTYNTDRQVPDSAATATALFTGVKTRFGLVSLDDRATRGDCDTYTPDMHLKTLFYIAKEAGKSVGLITTSRLTHATPSTTYAHTPERWWEMDHQVPGHCRGKVDDVASQFVSKAKDFDVVFAGGRKYFLPTSESDPEYPDKKGGRTDNRNLIKEWEDEKARRNLTYKFVWRQKEFDELKSGSYDRVLGLFDYDSMQFEAYRSKDGAGEPALHEMTETAIKLLSRNDNGFLLFVESALLDHAHHRKHARLAFDETVEMDRAVRAVTRMTNEKDTLILVTADHSHVMAIAGYPLRGNPILSITGPDKAKDGKYYTTILYANGKAGPEPREDPNDEDTESFTYSFHSGIPLGGETHGGEDVPVYARGPRSHLLAGVYEQNYITHAIMYAAGLERPADAKLHVLVTSNGHSRFIECQLLVASLLSTIVFSVIR